MNYFLPFWKEFERIADRVPFITWGIGCCNHKDRPTIPPVSLFESVLSKSRLNIVRDDFTKNLFQNLHLPPTNHCPAINYLQPVPTTRKAILHVVNYALIEEGYETIRQVCLDYAKEKRCPFSETNNRVGELDQVPGVHDLYLKSDVIVSSALHGCIIGLSLGRKVIAISGDTKIESFMNSIGLGDWVIDRKNIETLQEKLDHIEEQETPYNKLELIRNENKKIAAQIKGLIKNLGISANKLASFQ
jgi:hypothetical protein